MRPAYASLDVAYAPLRNTISFREFCLLPPALQFFSYLQHIFIGKFCDAIPCASVRCSVLHPIGLISNSGIPSEVSRGAATFMAIAARMCGLVRLSWWFPSHYFTNHPRDTEAFPADPNCASAVVLFGERPVNAIGVIGAIANEIVYPLFRSAVVYFPLRVSMAIPSPMVHGAPTFSVNRLVAVLNRAMCHVTYNNVKSAT